MRFYWLIKLLLIGSLLSWPLIAQEEAPRVRGELNLRFDTQFLGFGSDYHAAVPAMGRYVQKRDLHQHIPGFSIGLEGVLLTPLHQGRNVRLYTSFGYHIAYSHEQYRIFYRDTPSFTNEGTGVLPGSEGYTGMTDRVFINAITNHFNVGIRIQHQHSRLYGNISFGVLFYNPFNMRWRRQSANGYRTYSVTGGQSQLISDNRVDSTNFFFWLRSTSEVMATLSGRVGYGPVFMGITYATNVRVNSLSVDLGVNLIPTRRS